MCMKLGFLKNNNNFENRTIFSSEYISLIYKTLFKVLLRKNYVFNLNIKNIFFSDDEFFF